MKQADANERARSKPGRDMHFEQPQGDMENSRAYYGQPVPKRKPRAPLNATDGTNYQNGDFDRNKSQVETEIESEDIALDNASLSTDEPKETR